MSDTPHKKNLNFIDFYSLRKTFEEKSIRRSSENLEHFPQLYLISIVNTCTLSLRANPQGKNSESAHDDDDGTFTTYNTALNNIVIRLLSYDTVCTYRKGKTMTIVSFNHVQSEPICHKIYIL